MEPNSSEQALVFFKVCPEAITPDNLYNTVSVTSIGDSPVSGLFHTLQKVYAPALLQSKSFDPNLQSLLNQLEAGLGTVIRKQSAQGKGSILDDNLGGNIDFSTLSFPSFS